ncbi:MAG: phosphotransferase [Chromatiales bacterium]|nr:phosphotransferase [Chromatiales bacterium]
MWGEVGSMSSMGDPLHSAERVALDRLGPLLDSAVLTEAVARSPWHAARAGRVLACEVTRVHPRGARGLGVEIHVGLVAGEPGRKISPVARESLIGELVPEDVAHHLAACRARLGKSRRGQVSRRELEGRLFALPELGLVVRERGLDERLDALRLAATPSAGAALVPAADAESVRASLLAHRLGKRCVVRVRGDGAGGPRSVVVKGYRTGSGRATVADGLARRLRDGGLDGRGGVRVPRPLGVVEDMEAAVMEDLPDDGGAWLARGDESVAHAAGRALAALHASPVQVEAWHGPDAERTVVDRFAALLATARPELALRVGRSLVQARLALAALAPGEVRLAHRDYHEKQITNDAEGAVIYDFDTVCMADPALDLGNFLAHVTLAALRHPIDEAAVAAAFLDGYGVPDRALARRVSTYRSVSCLRLACVHGLAVGGDALARGLLER